MPHSPCSDPAADTTSNQSESESSSSALPANYFGQLAAANHVKKLIERYLSLAPVFIGGPAETSLEAPQHPPPLNETEKGMQMQNATFQVIKHLKRISMRLRPVSQIESTVKASILDLKSFFCCLFFSCWKLIMILGMRSTRTGLHIKMQ